MSDKGSIGNSGRVDAKWKPAAIAAFVVATLSSIVAGMQIYDWVTETSGPKFSVSAFANSFNMPPASVMQLMEIENHSELNSLTELKGFLSLAIRNTGDIDARDVRVDVNDSGFAVIEFDDETIKELAFAERIEIGVLQSDQTVRLSIWGKEASFFENSTPLLLHRDGRTPIKLNATVDKLWFYFFVSSIFVLLSWIAQNFYNAYRLSETRLALDKTAADIESKLSESREELARAFEEINELQNPNSIESHLLGKLPSKDSAAPRSTEEQ